MAYIPDIYGQLYYGNESQKTADLVVVTDGTITAGSVSDTTSINQQYLTVQETGQFKIDFTFSGLNGPPVVFEFVGRYEGNPAHNVEVKVWNFDTTSWDDVDAGTGDIPHSATDDTYIFNLAENQSYISGGVCKFRLEHTSSATASHYMYVDYVDVTGVTLDMPVAGTAYQLIGYDEGPSNGITLNGSAGSITIKEPGTYWFIGSISFSGLGNAVYRGHLYINGVKAGVTFKRKLGANGDVGSASGCGMLTLAKDDILVTKFVSDIEDSYLAVDALSIMLKKLF